MSIRFAHTQLRYSPLGIHNVTPKVMTAISPLFHAGECPLFAPEGMYMDVCMVDPCIYATCNTAPSCN